MFVDHSLWVHSHAGSHSHSHLHSLTHIHAEQKHCNLSLIGIGCWRSCRRKHWWCDHGKIAVITSNCPLQLPVSPAILTVVASELYFVRTYHCYMLLFLSVTGTGSGRSLWNAAALRILLFSSLFLWGKTLVKSNAKITPKTAYLNKSTK